MFEFLTPRSRPLNQHPGQLGVENLEDRAVPAVISGYTFQDVNLDGIRQATEQGIAGVQISLYNANNQLVATTTTDSTGRYQFTIQDTRAPVTTILRPGKFFLLGGSSSNQTVQSRQFIIRQTQPTDWINFTSNELRVTISRINQQVTGKNFGEILPGSIGGRVYFDRNKTGSFHSSYPGIAGVVIVLTGRDSLGNQIQMTTTTDAQGLYNFNRLTSGQYNLQQFQPAGYNQGAVTVGSLGGTRGIDTVTGIQIRQGDNGRDYNFGETRNSTTRTPPENITTIVRPGKFFLLGGMTRR